MARHIAMIYAIFFAFALAGLAVSPAAAAPSAAFSASPTAGIAPLAVSFTDASTGSPAGWAWYFGDEAYSAANWTRQSDVVEWTPRAYAASVALPDGSIVMTGGYAGGGASDVWRSANRGATWTRQTAAAQWPGRSRHAAVCLPDGSIVIMGGVGAASSIQYGDAWRSTDRGVTWTQQTSAAAWGTRYGLSAAPLPDGRIALTGGYHYDSTQPQTYGDLWISADRGATWTEQDLGPFSGILMPRRYHGSVALPDGSVLVVAGSGPGRIGTWGWQDDAVRLVERGSFWTPQSRFLFHQLRAHSCVLLRDGSVAVFGGETNADRNWDQRDDAWLLETASSTARNPVHVYTKAGSYDAALRVYSDAGSASVRRTAYINVTAVLAVPPGADLPTDMDADRLCDDVNGNGRPDFADVVLYFNQMNWIAANEPVAAFDYNGNGRIDFADAVWLFTDL